MSVFRSKTPSLHDRHAHAASFAADALSVFHGVAEDLKLAAETHSEVADEAQAEADRHLALRDAATEAAAKAKRQAEAVAALLG